MKDSITRIYCVCDEFVKTMCIEDNGQCRWSSAQVMTAVIVAARHFGGNLDLSRRFLLEHGHLQPLRKAHLKRQWPAGHRAKLNSKRQRIETTSSQIVALLPRHLKAVTAQGFVLKVHAFLLAFCFQCLDKVAT